MRFITTDTMFFKQGTEKAHVVHDQRYKKYYIPRSKVTILETIEPVNDYDIAHHVIEIPDWIIRNNQIPVFDLCELALDR